MKTITHSFSSCNICPHSQVNIQKDLVCNVKSKLILDCSKIPDWCPIEDSTVIRVYQNDGTWFAEIDNVFNNKDSVCGIGSTPLEALLELADQNKIGYWNN